MVIISGVPIFRIFTVIVFFLIPLEISIKKVTKGRSMIKDPLKHLQYETKVTGFFLVQVEISVTNGKYECRTKHPQDKTPPAHFGIGGQNTPHVFYRVDITPPATYERVDKTPLVSFARWTKSPLSCGQPPPPPSPPRTESSVFTCYRILVP